MSKIIDFIQNGLVLTSLFLALFVNWRIGIFVLAVDFTIGSIRKTLRSNHEQ